MLRASGWILLGVLLTDTFGSAYESDVHYGLTYWLARNAGLSAARAEIMASADQALDEGPDLPAPKAVVHILTSNSVSRRDMIANEIRINHFPSRKHLPAPPKDREVIRGGADARLLVDEAIKAKDLRQFGRALHAFQDSWAHVGVPDIPARPLHPYESTRIFGHPCGRGSWFTHNADLTYLWPPLTVEMAHETYDFINKYIEQTQTPREHIAVPWDALVNDVGSFTARSTKADKQRWFSENSRVSFQEYRPNFLVGIDLPDNPPEPVEPVAYDCSESFEQLSPYHKWRLLKILASSSISDFGALFTFPSHRGPNTLDLADAEQQLLNALTVALVSHDPAGALPFFDLKEMKKQLEAMLATKLSEKEEATLIQEMLRAALIEDHGIANQRAHGMSLAALRDGQPNLDTKMHTYESLDEALEPLGSEGQTKRKRATLNGQSKDRLFDARPDQVLVVPAKESALNRRTLAAEGLRQPVIIGAFALRRLPHDVVLVLMGRSDGQWKIQRLYWISG